MVDMFLRQVLSKKSSTASSKVVKSASMVSVKAITEITASRMKTIWNEPAVAFSVVDTPAIHNALSAESTEGFVDV